MFVRRCATLTITASLIALMSAATVHAQGAELLLAPERIKLDLTARQDQLNRMVAATPEQAESLNEPSLLNFDLGEARFVVDDSALRLEEASGVSARGSLNLGGFSLSGQVAAAISPVESPTLFDGARPRTWGAELGYAFGLGGLDTLVALGYQGSGGAPGLINAPEDRFTAGLSFSLMNSAALALEWRHDRDSAEAGFASQADDAATLRLHLPF
ncbi:hypothetical protein [Magnetofaba australis]|uniref:Uncharacterized protein n=1 Tax=Magnetofaba australis IT-1 TaxID=1434232 RepID=A0A1Y2K1E7_9PROT|nr:hypothetical protein [Magnetofaba australis]OSM01833.1 hypothetical protein MAIT1_01878 [Magnetofaba australis IT-1]